MTKRLVCVLFAGVLATAAWAAEPVNAGGPKVFVAPMENGFNTYISAALMKKHVPVTIVADRAQADFEITGAAESQKAGWAKILMTGSVRSDEQASIQITNLKSGEVVWAYAVNKSNSFFGKQSAAESCAKHFGNYLRGK